MKVTAVEFARARQRLVRRIERFLDRLDRRSSNPTLWECKCIEEALYLLEGGSFAGGELAMMQAEQADLFGTPQVLAKIAPTPQVRSVAELRARLAVILQEAD